jgi:hypothetical protein
MCGSQCCKSYGHSEEACSQDIQGLFTNGEKLTHIFICNKMIKDTTVTVVGSYCTRRQKLCDHI